MSRSGFETEQLTSCYGFSGGKGKSGAAAVTTSEFNQVLLVSVHNMLYPITGKELHQVFDPYGCIENIIITSTTSYGLQALIQFHSSHCAIQAKNHLHGRNIYDGCCQLDIQYFRSGCNFGSTNLGQNDFSKRVSGMIAIVEKMLTTVNNLQSRIEKMQFVHTQKCELFNNFAVNYRSAKLKKNHGKNDLTSMEQSTARLYSVEKEVNKADAHQTHQTTNLYEKTEESKHDTSLYKKVKKANLDKNLLEKSVMKYRSSTKVSSLLNSIGPVNLFAPLGGATTSMFLPFRSRFFSFGISGNICFGPGNINRADKLCDVMFEKREYGMFGLVLVQNDKICIAKTIFIFDPGGGAFDVGSVISRH